MIIALSGVDGSGKTTLSRGLVEKLNRKRLKAKRFYLGDYFLLLWPVRLLHFFYVLFKCENSQRARENPFLGTQEKPTLMKCWLLFVIIDNFINYLRLRFYSSQGYYVVCDRYFYDKLIGFEYHGYSCQFLSWLYLKLAPLPDLTFILDLDERISQERESSGPHPLSFYKEVREGYHKLREKINCRLVFVGDKKEKEVLGEVLAYIKGYLRGKRLAVTI